MLALVLLAAVEAGLAAAAAVDGDADLEQQPAVVPAADLGADDRDATASVLGDPQQLGERVGLGRAVVVQQPEPLDRPARLVVLRGLGGAAPRRRFDVGVTEARGDGGAEAGARGKVEDAVGAEGVSQQGADSSALPVSTPIVRCGGASAEQPREHLGEPAGAVVGDDDRGHQVARELDARTRGHDPPGEADLEGRAETNPRCSRARPP